VREEGSEETRSEEGEEWKGAKRQEGLEWLSLLSRGEGGDGRGYAQHSPQLTLVSVRGRERLHR
jgi:hypothetical protein